MRNLAQVSRREVEAHRRTVTGITAEKPRYAVVDSNGAEEWVVDVFLGEPRDQDKKNLVRNCPIAPYARQLIGDVRQPVELQRSKQGRYTVIGRGKVVPAGAQMPEGTILEPTYHEKKVNLAQLGLLFIPDLDWQREPWGLRDWGEPGKPYQIVRAFDAFGAQVVGPEVDNPPPALALEPAQTTTTRHLVIKRKPWGHGPGSFQYGTDRWGAMSETVVEHTE